jgi:outer membrane protein TolC
MEHNTDIRLAQSDVRAKEFRYRGEKGGYLPTVELVTVYSLLAKFNNYDQFFQTFQRNNLNAGVQVQMPVFSARTKAAVGLADVNLQVAQATLENKKNQVSADVRKKTRRLREMDATKEVARLQLQLARQSVSALQSQFEEGKTNLRDVERARLEESDRWMAYLDATFQRQQAQVELLRTAGQLDKVLE